MSTRILLAVVEFYLGVVIGFALLRNILALVG